MEIWKGMVLYYVSIWIILEFGDVVGFGKW